MKIALASAPVKSKDIEFNVDSMIDTMRKVSEKADVIVFGESVLQGFDCLCWDYETDKTMAVSLHDAPIRKIQDAAKNCGLAVSFGFIEQAYDSLFSSQIFIGPDSKILNLFHRVSVGWKEYSRTDDHYREGLHFEKFSYGGKTFATGLCGDLWTDGRPEEMNALVADVVLWPVWCDYSSTEWNSSIKYEYAHQAGRCGNCVLLVNPYCADTDAIDAASGGAACFRNGKVSSEIPAGESGILYIDI